MNMGCATLDGLLKTFMIRNARAEIIGLPYIKGSPVLPVLVCEDVDSSYRIPCGGVRVVDGEINCLTAIQRPSTNTHSVNSYKSNIRSEVDLT